MIEQMQETRLHCTKYKVPGTMYQVPLEAPFESAHESPLLHSSIGVRYSTLKEYQVTSIKTLREARAERQEERLHCTRYQAQGTKIEQMQEPRHKKQDFIILSTMIEQMQETRLHCTKYKVPGTMYQVPLEAPFESAHESPLLHSSIGVRYSTLKEYQVTSIK